VKSASENYNQCQKKRIGGTMGLMYEELTDKIIQCFYTVHNSLGYGFSEHLYEKAMMYELAEMGLRAENQKLVEVFYKGHMIGEYKPDIIVEDKVIIEIKSVSKILPIHETQLVNYLRATGIKIGLLVNFGERVEFKRRIFDRK